MVEAPEGVEGAGFFATSLEKVVGIARSNSLWPLPFATSCCGIEFMATMGSHYDIARFGSERPSFLAPPGRFIDGNGNDCEENGANCKAGV